MPTLSKVAYGFPKSTICFTAHTAECVGAESPLFLAFGSWTLIRWYRAGVPCEASKKFASGSGANLQLQHQKGIWCELVQSGVMLSMTRCGLGEVGPPECPTLRPSATSKRWESYRNPYRKDDALRSLLFFRAAREAALAADLIMAASKYDKNCQKI